MNTHTTYTFKSKEEARQEMHRWLWREHEVWAITTQPLRADGKRVKQHVFAVDANGKRTSDKSLIAGWAIKVEQA